MADQTTEVAISIDHVSKTFRLPHEKSSSLKSLVINFWRRKKGYEIQQALDDVTFDIKKGEFFGIVGRNGSGKSTMLKLLAGIYTPTKGGIQVNGKLTPFIELGVGFNQELTGRENVFLNGALLGFSRKEMFAMYDDIVHFAELKRFMDQKLKNYSSGMQVRLAFSIAIRARTDILLLDEVLAVGDAAFQQKCYNYFDELKREKKTVVFVSHDMGALRRFCTRAAYIENGKLTHIGSATEIADIYTSENIDVAQKNAQEDGEVTNSFKLSSKIAKQTDSSVKLRIQYGAEKKEDMYLGISLLKDGVSIAEIVTAPDKSLSGAGTIWYDLDTSVLNAGIYQLDAALFRRENRQLLVFTREKAKFTIKGEDPSRGAALKLKDSWEYGP